MLSKVNEEVSCIKSLLIKTHEEALIKNEEQINRWQKYKTDHENLHSRLLSFRDKLTHPVMVPIGTKALMKGSLVHTNEVLVCLGDHWFANKSANEAAELCQRRIKGCDEMLDKLKKEQDLLESRKSLPLEHDTFGKEEAQEIIEPYDEEEEKAWRVRHRQKEKEYYQKLAELKKHQKVRIETEEDLWKRLDALDLQEELEDELDRLDVESEESTASETETESSDDEVSPKSDRKKNEHRVSFDNLSDACEDDDVIQIRFKHSNHNPPPCTDLTPNSIYTMFPQCFNRAPKSILKRTSSYQDESNAVDNTCLKRTTSHEEVGNITNYEEQGETKIDSRSKPISIALGDVVEKTQQSYDTSNSTRPVSKFKAARQAAKAQNK